MRSDWTINTCVLYLAADLKMDSIELLLGIRRKADLVTFDDKRRIDKEYETCLLKAGRDRRPGTPLVKEWFKLAVGRLVQRLSGALQRRHRLALQRLKFDATDWPFVAVCSRTTSKKLVSEDSDYTHEVKTYLEQQMGVHLLSVEESLKPAG